MADISSNLPTNDKADGATGTAVPSVSLQVGGSDGTNIRTLSTDASGKLKIDLNDGSGNPITSNSNGTAGNQVLHVATPDTTTASTALGALNATISISLAGMSSVGFQILAGTLIGTIKAQASVDGGTTWADVPFYDPVNSSVLSSVVFGSSNTTKILSILPIGGSSNVRVIVSAYTSGTANSVLRASEVTSAAGAITAAAFSTATQTNFTTSGAVTQLVAANTNRKYLMIANNGNQTMHCQFATGTGLTATTGFPIASAGVFELKGDNLFTGAIFYLAAGTVAISVIEGTP